MMAQLELDRTSARYVTKYNKTIIGWGFCDIQNDQGLGKCNQPRPSASADYSCLYLDYSEYHKNLIQLLYRISTTYT